MSDDSVDRVFEKAIATIQTLSSQKGYNSLPRPPAHVRIQLYALFKQSTEGDVKHILAKPEGNPTSPEYNLALRKWEAWKSKEGQSPTDAKKSYIELLIHTMKTYAMGTIVARELLSELEFMWWQISRSNPFDGVEADYKDETNSVLMLTTDNYQDNVSEKMRKEVYETLAMLRPKSARKDIVTLPTKSALSDSSDEFFGIWTALKRTLLKLLTISKQTAVFLGKRIIYQFLTLLMICFVVKWTKKAINFEVRTNESSHEFWVLNILRTMLNYIGLNKVSLHIQ